MCDEPKATTVGVAKRLGMSPGLIHGYRRMRREAEKLSSEPLQFIAYGSVAEPRSHALAPTPVARASTQHTAIEELTRSHLGTRPGAISIDLPSDIRLSVDSYVNEKARARVLRALRDVARSRWRRARRSILRANRSACGLASTSWLRWSDPCSRSSPMAGHVFLFRSKSGNYLKALHRDGTGLCLFAKKLEPSRFVWPPSIEGGVVLTPVQFALLIEAMDWRRTVAPDPPRLPVQN